MSLAARLVNWLFADDRHHFYAHLPIIQQQDTLLLPATIAAAIPIAAQQQALIQASETVGSAVTNHQVYHPITPPISPPQKPIVMTPLRPNQQQVAPKNENGGIVVQIGIDNDGNIVYDDISKMPHLLIAAASGGGKTTLFNSIICDIISRYSSDYVGLIMIDTKLGFMFYPKIPHLMDEIADEFCDAMPLLSWAQEEMKSRNKIVRSELCEDIYKFNHKTGKHIKPIIICIEEFDEITAKPEAEAIIINLAKRGRSAGIHLIMATQKPTADVLSTHIKSNMSCIAALKTASRRESHNIFERPIAASLKGNGDMWYIGSWGGEPKRLQCRNADGDFIARVVERFNLMK